MDAFAAVYPQSFQESVIGGFRRVGNVGDGGFVKTVFQGVHDLRRQGRAESLAFPVDDGVVAAGEVDFFKGAGSGFQRGGEFRDGVRAVRLDGKHVGGGKLVHLFAFHFKYGHQGDAFGGHRDEFVRNQVVAGADAVGVAQAEVVSVADGPHDGVAAVQRWAELWMIS